MIGTEGLPQAEKRTSRDTPTPSDLRWDVTRWLYGHSNAAALDRSQRVKVDRVIQSMRTKPSEQRLVDDRRLRGFLDVGLRRRLGREPGPEGVRLLRVLRNAHKIEPERNVVPCHHCGTIFERTRPKHRFCPFPSGCKDARPQRPHALRLLSRGLTFREAAEMWLKEARSGALRDESGQPFEPSTLHSYYQALERLVLQLGDRRIASVGERDKQRVFKELNEEGASASTIFNAVYPLYSIVSWAVQRQTTWVRRDPMEEGRLQYLQTCQCGPGCETCGGRGECGCGDAFWSNGRKTYCWQCRDPAARKRRSRGSFPGGRRTAGPFRYRHAICSERDSSFTLSFARENGEQVMLQAVDGVVETNDEQDAKTILDYNNSDLRRIES